MVWTNKQLILMSLGRAMYSEQLEFATTAQLAALQAEVDALGATEPEYVVEDAWVTTGTRTLTTASHKLFINNSGNADLTFTVNGLTSTVKALEEFEDVFDPFTTVTITATDSFESVASALKSNSTDPLYSVKDYISGSTNTTRYFTGAAYGFMVSNDGLSSLSYTIGGVTVTIGPGEVSEQFFDAFTEVTIASTVAFRAGTKSTYLVDVTGSDTPAPVDITAPTITASVATGTYGTTQTVSLSSNDATATIYYTLDGTTPTSSSSVYSTALSITATTTLKYIGIDTTGNVSTPQIKTYTIDTVAPVITASVLTGTYVVEQTVMLTADETATIYYTLDGTTPTVSSSVYATALSISSTTTLKYFGKDTAGNSSTVETQTYTLNIPDTTAPTVTILPAVGTYGTTQSVTLSANETATIYYTLDGSTPTEASTVYSTAISVSATTTIKYFGKDTAGNSSTVQTATYTIDTISPAAVTGLTAGTPTATTIPLTWTLSSSGDVANYEVSYSSGGSYVIASSSVNSSSTSYTINGLTSDTAYTIRVITIDNAGNRSGLTDATTIASTASAPDTTAPAEVTLPIATPSDTTVDLSWTASTSTDIAGYNVYIGATKKNTSLITTASYTVTGLTAETPYTFTIKAVDTSNNESTGVNVSTTTTATALVQITASSPSGYYATSQSITLSSTNGETIRYVDTGGAVTTSSPIFTPGVTTISWTSTGTIRARTDVSGVLGDVFSFWYIIGSGGGATGGHYFVDKSVASLGVRPVNVSFDEIEIDMTPQFNTATGAWQYYFDFRAGIANGYLARNSTDKDSFGTGFQSVTVDGVLLVNETDTITPNVRHLILIKLNSLTTFNSTGYYAGSATGMNAKMYGIRLLNNGAAVCDFDLSESQALTPNVLIDKINGFQLNNSGSSGAVWVTG